MRLLIGFVVTFFIGVWPAFAAGTWWVDPTNGVDAAGRGSEAQPYLTLQAAVDAASAGDTLKLQPGVYAEGERSMNATDNTHTNRVVIDKKLMIEGVGGRGRTFIAGRVDPTTGSWGPAGIRCVYVTADGRGTIIKNVTLKDGAAGNVAVEMMENYGGGLLTDNINTRDVYLVDCDILNCSAYWGGGMRGGTAIRCRFKNNFAQSTGAAARYANLLNCLLVKNRSRADELRGTVGDNCILVNCTLAANLAGSAGGNGCTAYNCIQFGNLFGSSPGATWTDSYTTATGMYLLFSPATDDYRLTAGTAAVGGGKSAILKNLPFPVPAGTAMTDFAGTPIDLSGDAVDAGCCQGAATPAGGRILFKNEAFEVDGVTNLFNQGNLHYASESWPVMVAARPLAVSANPFAYCTVAGWTSYDFRRFPDETGRLWLVPPPLAGEMLQVTPVRVGGTAAQPALFWAAADATPEGADGSEAHPYPVLQDAVDHATNVCAQGTVVLINVKPGDYRSGGRFSADAPARVVLPGTHPIILKSTHGAASTTIWGAADENGPYPDGYVGCGPNSVRCVSMESGYYHVLQGFTLADGHSLCVDYTKDIQSDRGGAAHNTGGLAEGLLADCVITNCTSVRATLYNLTMMRCRLYDCHGFGGVMRYTRLSSSYIDPTTTIGSAPADASANMVLGNGTLTVLCTAPNASLWSDRIYLNTLFGSLTPDSRQTLWGSVLANANGSSATATGFAVADPAYMNAAQGDWRLPFDSPAWAASRLPEAGTAAWGVWATNFATFATCGIDGAPLRVKEGKPLPGCWQKPASGVRVTAANGGLAITGGTTGFNQLSGDQTVAVSRAMSATRPCIGFTVNGVTNLFDDAESRTFTAEDVSASEEGGFVIEALYANDWYVNPNTDAAKGVVGDDAQTGFTPKTAMRTLAAVLAKARSGDTVHAAPGTYADGSAQPFTDEVKYAGRCHNSRAVIPAGVTLVSDKGAEETVIVGARDTSDFADANGLGTNAVRGVYLFANAKLRGFTVTGGYTRPKQNNLPAPDYIEDSSGGGICGYFGGRTDVFVEDCIISNNYAYTGGAIRYLNAVRCKLFNNHAVGSGGALRGANLWGCVVDYCYSGSTAGQAGCYDFTKIVASTLGPHNFTFAGTAANYAIHSGSSGIAYLRDVLVLGSCGANGAMTMPCSNTVFAAGAGSLSYDAGSCTVLSVDPSTVVDGDLRPLLGASAVVDAADAADLVNCGVEFDASGSQRIYNGAPDIGALESDWRPRYAMALGRQFSVGSAASNVAESASGTVTLSAGAKLEGTCGKAPSLDNVRYVLTFAVRNGGSLTVTVNGEDTVYAEEGTYRQEFTSAAAVNALAFACTAGTAEIIRVESPNGTVFIMR